MASNANLVTSRDYEERVYAGVLGKIIGVYLGRPFEQWLNERIERELGEINYYVHDKLGQPLIVTDDDITGTFTFLRALSENGSNVNLTAAQIGDWWLNTIIENQTILWWGGFGFSTEHTAYLRLKSGIRAPQSGSIATNGRAVAEEIGSQIFIDGWGMICPGEPERAADFARRAASVSHDGEAIYGAQVVAAMEALAFVEPDLNKLLDAAVGLIPTESLIAQLISDMREWAGVNGDDWRATLRQVHTNYGYERFGTGCPMVSNHAMILLALLHGNDNFQRSLMIVNTAGYDTDCNSGNVGCLLGIKNGLATLNAGPDWRGPVADRLYLPTADGGRAITDALRESYAIIDLARACVGQESTLPKQGARFHFTLPGSVQGFQADSGQTGVFVSNDNGQLKIEFDQLTSEQPVRVATPTFTPPDALQMGGYALLASPTLYSGQTLAATILSGPELSKPITVGLYLQIYGKNNTLNTVRGPAQILKPQESVTTNWVVPNTDGEPIAEVGIEIMGSHETKGSVLLDNLTWTGTPNMILGKPSNGSTAWEKAWINSTQHNPISWSPPPFFYRVIQDHGVGLVTQGESSWSSYTVSTEVLLHLSQRVGLVACAQGLRRYVALVFDQDHTIRLVEQRDTELRVLAESSLHWKYEDRFEVSITVTDHSITASVGETQLVAIGTNLPNRGAVGMLVEVGHAEFSAIVVKPA